MTNDNEYTERRVSGADDTINAVAESWQERW